MSDEAIRNLKNAIAMAMADGSVSDPEKDVLRSFQNRMGIDRDEFNQAVQEVKSSRKLSISKGPRGIESLRALIEVAAADGIGEVEKKVLVKVARHVGLDEEGLAKFLPAPRPTAGQEETFVEQSEALYANFAAWDDAARRDHVRKMSALGCLSVPTLVGLLESYRRPDGCETTVAMKTLLAEALGEIGDRRAVYYLSQQVSIGDSDDEITSADLRAACAHAIGRIAGVEFPQDESIVPAARQWWLDAGRDEYNQLMQ